MTELESVIWSKCCYLCGNHNVSMSRAVMRIVCNKHNTGVSPFAYCDEFKASNVLEEPPTWDLNKPYWKEQP